MSTQVAIGPNGANLLGFLASVGALAALTEAWPEDEVRMSWTLSAASWRPVFHTARSSTKDGIVDVLDSYLAGRESSPEFTDLGADLTVEPAEFAAFASRAAEAATASDRRCADFAAAYGCDALTTGSNIQDTALRTMSGAGHQHFLGFMRELAQVTTRDDIRRALFDIWRYEDERPSMRWDPVDDRRYAHRADNPATSRAAPIRTVRGANRLAIEGLRCFPTMPSGSRLATTGFTRLKASRQWTIRWPIWGYPTSCTTLASLLASSELVAESLDSGRLRAMGVTEVFASRRQTVGQLRSFLPAEALLGCLSEPTV